MVRAVARLLQCKTFIPYGRSIYQHRRTQTQVHHKRNMRPFEASEPRYMVAHASANQNVAPPGHPPSRGPSPANGAMDEKETEEKPASKHICSNASHERAWEKTSIAPDSPTMPPCASEPSSANTPCATQSLPPGANTRANSANAAGNDHARFTTLLMYTWSNDASSMQAWERLSGIAGEKRR